MASIFSRIIKGESPCYKIAESENCFAFLDINPLKKGHTLVVPKEEVDYLFDLGDNAYSELCLFSKKIASAIKKTVPCKRVAVVVLGLEVPHAHIHLVPIDRESDIRFSNPRLKLTDEELEVLAKQIRENIPA